MSTTTMKAVTSATIACSFVLVGNAITQSFMGVPALLVDFPLPRSASHAERARLLGGQWPVFWAVGNRFFRPISTLGIVGYGVAAWTAATSSVALHEGGRSSGSWKFFAIAAGCHVVNVPINERIAALAGEARDNEKAEEYARRWKRLNLVRLVMPLIAGTLAMTQVLGN
ncbi:hypothetical protein PGQ11_011299 [Apiospora arundinis]|uniref:DUF1772 domain-containing protein n=1 Tax=Apiospora arundinis TaxID=335852 RepID=A0ABR2HZQ1_9PEZI